MSRRSKQRTPPAPRLSPEDAALLAEFTRRRADFDAALAASDILHRRHTCPVCGFPTLRERGAFEPCVVCLWEDSGAERDSDSAGPPNYASITQSRLHASEMMRQFERSHALDGTIDDLVRAIEAFTARWRRGDATIIKDDFTANLRSIVPTRPRAP